MALTVIEPPLAEASSPIRGTFASDRPRNPPKASSRATLRKSTHSPGRRKNQKPDPALENFPVEPPSYTFLRPPDVVTTLADPWPRPYYFTGDGLRRVRPYHYTYNTYCKERWRGREILEIFEDEFRDRSVEYYRQAILTGNVHINGSPVPGTRVPVRNGDLISHTLHRHEPPVNAAPIKYVHEDDDLIIIDKPAGVPVHPTGRYNYNSVTEILRAERAAAYHRPNPFPSLENNEKEEGDDERALVPDEAAAQRLGKKSFVKHTNGTMRTKGRKDAGPVPGAWNPMPCNRLDRLTSGLMIVGKHAAAADAMMRKLRSRAVLKEYVARVVGEFPAPRNADATTEGDGDEGGDVACEQPILQISPKLGLNRVRAEGKDARTVFRRIAYYPPPSPPSDSLNPQEAEDERSEDARMPWKRARGYSIVRCTPLTGRTHQIRVHLQFLGHPITNDPIYCNQRVWGPSLGRGDAGPSSCTETRPVAASPDLPAMPPTSHAQHTTFNTALPPSFTDPLPDIQPPSDEDILTRLSRMGKTEAADAVAYHEELASTYAARKQERQTGERCDICGTELYSDPGVHELGIYLHAVRYKDAEGRWEYATELPEWAGPPCEQDGKEEDG